jgi:DNA-binding winged helix-turn-helix (wHTH) protein
MDSHDLGTSTVNETSPATRVIRFGVFEVDLRTAELRKQGVRIRLPGQSFQVLEALLLRPGELVTREELKQKLWPSDTFGDFEHGLNAAVNRVRDALGDSSDNPRFVETVPRRGYRFIAPVNGVAHSTGLDNVVHIAPPEPAPYEPPEPAPEPSQPKPRTSKLAAVIAVLACMIGAFAALFIAWWRIPSAVPMVESVVQLTDDGETKANLVSDGSRIYFNEGSAGNWKVKQVSIIGGPTAPVEARFANSIIVGLAPTVLHYSLWSATRSAWTLNTLYGRFRFRQESPVASALSRRRMQISFQMAASFLPNSFGD